MTELHDDGDTLRLDDGRLVRLRIETDQDTTINDYDSDGKVKWERRNDRGSVRPAGFTGRARIIDTDYPYNLWWEPYEGLTDEQARAEAARIRDLVRYGFVGFIVELCHGADAYGRPIVDQVASLWGIEWDVDDAYRAEIIRDLAGELGVDLA